MCVLIRLRRPSLAGKSQNRARAQGFATPRQERTPLRAARGSASMALRRAAPAGWRLLITLAAENPNANQPARRLHKIADTTRKTQ